MAVPFDQIARQVNPPPEPKRPVGRPRKDNPASAAAPASGPSTGGAAGAFNTAAGPSTTGAPPVLSMQSSGIPHPIIRNGLEMPFAMAAAKTGFHGFALAKDESDPLVPMADMLMGKWLPTIGPYGIELMFCGSIVSLAGVKYMAYIDHKKEIARKERDAARVSG